MKTHGYKTVNLSDLPLREQNAIKDAMGRPPIATIGRDGIARDRHGKRILPLKK